MTLDELRVTLRPLTEHQRDTWTDPVRPQHARRCRVSNDQRNGKVTIHECQCAVGVLVRFVSGEIGGGEGEP